MDAGDIVATNGAESRKKAKREKRKQRDVDGTAEERNGGETKPKKKKRKTEQDGDAADAAALPVTSTVEDIPADPAAGERKKKKKEKRKSDALEDASAEPSTSLPAEASSSKPKKSKKSKSAPEQVEALVAPLADVSVSALQDVPDKPKKAKKSKTVPPAEDVPDASSSAPAEKEQNHKKSERAPAPSSDALASAPSAAEVAAYLSTHAITLTLPDGAAPVTPALTFAQLSLPAELRGALGAFERPTPIQACTWPPALAGRDVVGIAETGSGKTLAFGLPALASLLAGGGAGGKKKKGKGQAAGGVAVLVLAPTRELALQTHETFDGAGTPLGIASVAVFGGVDKGAQVRALRAPGARVVVGTPGRIKDLVADGSLDLSAVAFLVLDEADRMLDKGFENDIRTIIGYTVQGKARQTLMFSATWPDSVRRLASSFLNEPVRVTVGSEDLTANTRIEQSIEIFDNPRDKDTRLLKQLQALKHPKTSNPSAPSRLIVFALYKKEAARVEGLLSSKGYAVMCLQGDMSQAGRLAALQAFKEGSVNTLVATDVAARGLDIPDVGVVLNYSFPLTIEDYVHRIGRTGRGGKSGRSITFFTGDGHEKALAGEFARLLDNAGVDCAEMRKRFPMTIKKKTHSVYGAHFRDDVPQVAPTKIKFE